MPKCRQRLICKEPDTTVFVPKNDNNSKMLILGVDEYESIRLIDLEGFSQEECAKKLRVARTTAQLIYNNAREKLAMALVYGYGLQIEGGNYVLCDGSPHCKKCHLYKENSNSIVKEEDKLRIAVTYDDGEVFQHFGHTEFFKLYDIDGDLIENVKIISSNGQGHGALASVLKEAMVDVLICGGIGTGAQNALDEIGIKLCSGASGDADQAVLDYLAGKLINSGANCSHHDKEDHCHEDSCNKKRLTLKKNIKH